MLLFLWPSTTTNSIDKAAGLLLPWRYTEVKREEEHFL